LHGDRELMGLLVHEGVGHRARRRNSEIAVEGNSICKFKIHGRVPGGVLLFSRFSSLCASTEQPPRRTASWSDRLPKPISVYATISMRRHSPGNLQRVSGRLGTASLEDANRYHGAIRGDLPRCLLAPIFLYKGWQHTKESASDRVPVVVTVEMTCEYRFASVYISCIV